MGFELFDKMSRTFAPKVSIRSNGAIGFSKGAVNKLGLLKYGHCKLYYDKERNYIGFEFKNDESPGVTTRIRRAKEDLFIFAKPFLYYYDIDHRETKVYEAKQDDESRMIYLDLGNPLYTSQRGRSAKK